MLPAQLAAQRHRGGFARLPLGVRTQPQRRDRRVGVLLVTVQRRRPTVFRDAVVLEVDVRQVGERLQIHPISLHAVTRFGKHLLGARTVFCGFPI
ncbi:hypothetical protein D3C77_708050 [compost metagenome]